MERLHFGVIVFSGRCEKMYSVTGKKKGLLFVGSFNILTLGSDS